MLIRREQLAKASGLIVTVPYLMLMSVLSVIVPLYLYAFLPI